MFIDLDYDLSKGESYIYIKGLNPLWYYECSSTGYPFFDIIYFKIDLHSLISDKSWTVFRRFSEFHDLYLILVKYFISVPKFPNKTLTKVKNFQEINNRKEELDSFLKVKI